MQAARALRAKDQNTGVADGDGQSDLEKRIRAKVREDRKFVGKRVDPVLGQLPDPWAPSSIPASVVGGW